MGVYVIAAYRPKKGKEQRLRDVLKDHLPILRKEAAELSAILKKFMDPAKVESG